MAGSLPGISLSISLTNQQQTYFLSVHEQHFFSFLTGCHAGMVELNREHSWHNTNAYKKGVEVNHNQLIQISTK